MRVWIVVRGILFGMAKLAGAIVMLGFSLGVIAGRKLKEDSIISLEDEVASTQDMAEDMTKAIENAAEQVINDLEGRTVVAVRLLDEAEEKIARLKDMLDFYEECALDEPIPEETALEEEISEQQLSAGDETAPKSAVDQAPKTVTAGKKASEEKHALVFQLADEGLSMQEIAKKAGIGCGEAELILRLRGNDD